MDIEVKKTNHSSKHKYEIEMYTDDLMTELHCVRWLHSGFTFSATQNILLHFCTLYQHIKEKKNRLTLEFCV